jgi:ribonuclease HI
MIHLPIYLEKKLKVLFSRQQDRNRFVAELVKEAIEREEVSEDDGPIAVGGTLHLFTDGGSRGNPGQAAIGCVLEDSSTGTMLREHCERIGIETNNVAEYHALIVGLKLALKYQPNRLICHLDSELVVRQLNGEYRVKMHSLQPLFEEIQELASQFTQIEFVHVARADNHRADALVNKALDSLPDPPYEKR